MKKIALAQYYLPIRNADAYSYKVQVGERLFGFHNLDKLSEDEEPQLIFCYGGTISPTKLYQTTLLCRRDNVLVSENSQCNRYANLAEGDYIITTAWDCHSKTGTESLIVNVLHLENYLSKAEATLILEDRYYYESSMPFRCRYAEQWLQNFEKRELAPFAEVNIGSLIAQGRRMEEIRREKKIAKRI